MQWFGATHAVGRNEVETTTERSNEAGVLTNPGRPGHRGFEEWASKHPDIVFVGICQSNSTKHMIGAGTGEVFLTTGWTRRIVAKRKSRKPLIIKINEQLSRIRSSQR